MYVWSEDIASRGSQEVSSCLLHFLKNVLPSSVKEITLYSDSCGGQNRNIKVALFLSYVLQTHPNIETINQKFFMPGHSFDSCDMDFAIIERSKAYQEEIYVPEKWKFVIQNAKKKSPKFVVHAMTKDEFYSSKTMEKEITNRKKTERNTKVSWLKMRWIQYRKMEPKKLYIKNTLTELEEFDIVDLAKKTRGRPSREFVNELELLHPRGRAITKEKKKDLLSLLKYIPPIYHDFYRKLRATEVEELVSEEEEEVDEDDEIDE